VQVLSILGLLAAVTTSVFALGAWLATRQHVALKTIGIVLSLGWALQCGMSAAAITAESLSAPRGPTLIDATAAFIYAATAVAAAVTVIRVLKPRPEGDPRITIDPKPVP
jgi:hypothetical protein